MCAGYDLLLTPDITRCVCDVDIIGELLGMSQAPTYILIYVNKQLMIYFENIN